MAEFLFKVREYTHEDADKDRRGVHKKGDFINYKPDGWSDGEHWGQSAYPYANGGKFITIKCPEITFAEAKAADHRQAWKDDFDYTVLATRAAQGEYDIRIFEKNAGASNLNSISGTKATRIRDYMTKWGCTAITLEAHAITFTLSLWNTVRSENFWNVEAAILSMIAFTLNSFVTGVATITADFSTAVAGQDQQYTDWFDKKVRQEIVDHGGVVTGSGANTVTFTIERSVVLAAFRADVKRRLEQVAVRHRYAISTAAVDTVIAAGGMVTVTKVELLAMLRDKMAE